MTDQPSRRLLPRRAITAAVAALACALAMVPGAAVAAPGGGGAGQPDLPAGAAPAAAVSPVDVQAHRGGLGLVVESTLAAFANALELGVTTLELDVQITEDGQAVVTHDRQVSAA